MLTLTSTAPSAAGLDDCFDRIGADLTLLKWMVGFNTAMMIAVLTILLRDMIA